MLSWYLKISRPRFWVYLFGPFLIGLVAAINNDLYWPAFVIFGLYFTFPANLLIYGVNDIFDYETDKHNPKKQQYEELVTPEKRRKLWMAILAWNLPLLVWLIGPLPGVAKLGLLAFIFLGIFYSMPPIRAKTKPFIDTVFNALYVFPGVFAYAVATESLPPLQVIAAATLWCMAMHAYSAVPDIAADKKAGIATIATVLGAKLTLIFCLVCYGFSAILASPFIGVFSVVAGAVYIGMMLMSLLRPDRAHVFSLYKYFPFVNMVIGAGLFFWVASLVK